MISTDRRYDIDWLRVIAIGLLLVYHIAIGFQIWGSMIGFIVNKDPWENLWVPMTMLNVWRIPLLFFVSGMGVYFAIQNRNWKQLLLERAKRIGIPFIFGIAVLVPLHIYVWQYANNWPLHYSPNPGHLWFLGNILIYIIIFLPLFYWLKRNEGGKMLTSIKKWFSTPLSIAIIVIVFVLEALLAEPMLYELYAMTWHGFFLGMLAFFFGFCMMFAGANYWKMLSKARFLFLLIAILLFVWRLMQQQMQVPMYQLAIESNFWIFSIFAFAYKYLNHPSKTLSYLSEAAYPVYLIHMIFLFLGSLLIFPLDMDVRLKFGLTLLFTGLGCLACYAILIKRFNLLRILFGLKKK